MEQDPKDEPAAELLTRIQTAKDESKGKVFPIVAADEEPFMRPSNWEWVRIGECLELINGRAFKPTDWQSTGLPIVRIQNLNDISAPFNFCEESLIEDRHLIDSGSFLISWSGTPGTSFGAFIWERGRAALNQHIFKSFQIGNPYFDKFLRIAINGRLDEMIAKAHGGVGLQHITKGKLELLVLPLPSLAEQHRIVTKVDELMKLCDEFEAAQAKRERRRDRLVAATLHGLNNGVKEDDSDDYLSFDESARFYFNNLPRLTTRQEHIQQLRQTILNLAVRGKLVPQSNADEPAANLLRAIDEKKRKLLKSADMKRDKKLWVGLPTTPPYSVPNNWAWTRLQDVFEISRGGSPRPAGDSRYFGGISHG